MSLLGRQVYANPTTPIWGQGGGSNLPADPTFDSVSFTPVGTPLASTQIRSDNLVGEGSTLHVMDPDGFVGPLAGTRFYAKGPPGRVIYQSDGIDFQDLGSTSYFLATIDTSANRWNLSNIATINGSNYPPGGGGGSNFTDINITGTGNLTFNSSATSTAISADGTGELFVGVDASGVLTNAAVGNLRIYGGGTTGSDGYFGVGNEGGGYDVAIRELDAGGTPVATYIGMGGGQMDLSNVSSINGVPYFNSPGTQFDYRNYPGGSPLVEAPDWGVLNAISFTPPVDGKVYVESLGTYVALVAGGGVSMTFAVDGTNISETATTINAYAGNTNLFGTSMYQFPVSANVTYDISSIAHCSAIPPSDPDVVVTSSRMFLMFSPQ